MRHASVSFTDDMNEADDSTPTSTSRTNAARRFALLIGQRPITRELRDADAAPELVAPDHTELGVDPLQMIIDRPSGQKKFRSNRFT